MAAIPKPTVLRPRTKQALRAAKGNYLVGWFQPFLRPNGSLKNGVALMAAMTDEHFAELEDMMRSAKHIRGDGPDGDDPRGRDGIDRALKAKGY